MSVPLRRFKSEIFQGLANPTRIAIVELLRDGELSAGQLIEKLGIEQANASQHLAVLRAKQIVVSGKVGNQVAVSIESPYRTICCSQIGAGPAGQKSNRERKVRYSLPAYEPE